MTIFRFILIILIAFLLSLSGSFGYLVYTLTEMEELQPAPFSLTTRIYDENDNLIAIRYLENRIEVPLEEISEHVIKATVAVEDHRYYHHTGFDLAGFGRALINNIKNRQVAQGGSTITQQLAKNLFLSHERTMERKIKEAIYTIHLERCYSKNEILEMYLNTIYYGHSAYGIEAAAQTYFGKSAASLTLAEAALLAGLPRGPQYYSPFINQSAAVQRQKTVLSQMEAVGVISTAEKEGALAEPLIYREPLQDEMSAYFIDCLVNVELARCFDGDLLPVYQGGLEIYTTLNPLMQQAAQEVIAGIPLLRMDETGKRQPQGALIALDPQTGYVKALVGGRDFSETKLNRVFSLRSPGSSFKPFIYAAALENGYTAADQVLCEPISLTEAGLDKPYEPTDFGGDFHHRDLTIREALVSSCNIAAIKTYVEIGREKAVEMAIRLGIESPLETYFSLPLGTVEVSLVELTTAFAPFANGGYRVEPILIRKVIDSHGQVIIENHPSREQVLDEKIAFLIIDILTGVVREGGTASSVASILNRTAAGKSGTSQDYKNTHMIGCTPDLVAGLYIGDDYEYPLGATGGRLAAPLWAEFMEKALQNTPPRDFTVPEGIVKVALCAETGLLRSPWCNGPEWEEYFIQGTEPVEQCDPSSCSYCKPAMWWPWLPWNAPVPVPSD
ncbi:MAG: PBP1A family penicillin-binding protein [Bacillota bacterium]